MGKSTFVPWKVNRIRQLHAAGQSVGSLAREHKVAESTIYRIVRRVSHRRVPDVFPPKPVDPLADPNEARRLQGKYAQMFAEYKRSKAANGNRPRRRRRGSKSLVKDTLGLQRRA